MDAPAGDPRDESIGDLFGRLIDDGKAYARAEVDLYRQIAVHRAGRARSGMVLLGAGAALLVAALIALTIGAVLGLAALTGPLLAGVIIAAALALTGYLLIRSGVTGLQALGGSEEEAAARKRGEIE
ncbi:MAG TPA: phage holin family protein [Allosphingosinicella sp.]|nr:phage holin family protein [Allosphingosinicella sp.]